MSLYLSTISCFGVILTPPCLPGSLISWLDESAFTVVWRAYCGDCPIIGALLYLRKYVYDVFAMCPIVGNK